MEKERSSKIISVIALVLAVVGMTIGFASFSTVLNITGEAEVKASNWEIKFNNLEALPTVGTAKQVGIAPTIDSLGTTISNYSVELTTPGDSISYTFDVENNGTFDAAITGITMAGKNGMTISCTGTNETDQNNVCSKLNYELVYVDSNSGAVAVGDELAKGTSKKMKLTLSYEDFEDESLLPENDVTVGNLGITITYGQK